MQKNIHARCLCQDLIEEQKRGLIMNHAVRPSVTSDDPRKQTYILSLTSYGHLSVRAKNSFNIYCLKCLTSSDLNWPLVSLNDHKNQRLISNFVLSYDLCLHAKMMPIGSIYILVSWKLKIDIKVILENNQYLSFQPSVATIDIISSDQFENGSSGRYMCINT